MGMSTAARQLAASPGRDQQRGSGLRRTHSAAASRPGLDSLQRSAGNHAVHRLLRSTRAQAKLAIGPANDEFERQADRVADDVARMPDSAARVTVSRAPESPQRLCAECEKEEEDEAEPVDAAAPLASYVTSSRGGGQPLPPSTRARFESRFGHDFGAVRIHDTARSAAAAAGINALAFTVGSNIHFGSHRFQPGTSQGDRLLAHELTHTIQQTGGHPVPPTGVGSQPAEVVQRAGDPAAIPPGLPCPTDLTAGRPAGTDILFGTGASAVTAAHTAQLTTFRTTWLASGGTDDILVHGYASPAGQQAANWSLSCARAQAVQAELVRLGIPPVRITVAAHGESSDFGSSGAANQHAVVSSSASVLPLPLVTGLLTPVDNFTGRSATRFGVGEVINLSFFSLPPRPAADFGGLEWRLVAGGGVLTGVNPAGTATYTAPAAASAVQLELRVATGATAGRVVSTHSIAIVVPNGVRMTAVPGTAPGFANPGVVPAGRWGAGFQANVFLDPRDVSFQGVVFGEGTVVSVVTPAGGFQAPFAGLAHPVNTFGAAHGGNATTGTPVSPPVDNITTGQLNPSGSLFGVATCGAADFLWAIPWEFSVAGGPRTQFAVANHHATSSLFCEATIEKGGAGPFCRRINGTTC
jgi:outer membrane protein OmpA-like peptidoglycan-associated protein